MAGSTGWEGKSAGRAREALMAEQYSPGWHSELQQAAVMPCSALRSGSREAGEGERRERERVERERERSQRVDSKFSQNFQWELEKF